MIPVSLTSSRTSLQGPANRYAQATSRAKRQPPLSPGERQRKFLAEANLARERKRSAVAAQQQQQQQEAGTGGTGGDGDVELRHRQHRRRGNSVDPSRTLEHRKSAPPASAEFASKGLRSIWGKSPSRGAATQSVVGKEFLALPGREEKERRASGSEDPPSSPGVEPLDRHVSCVNLPSRTLSPTWALTSIWRSTSSVFGSSPNESQANLEEKSMTASALPAAAAGPGKPKLKRRVSAWEAVKKKAQRSLTWLTARSEESLLDQKCLQRRRRRRKSSEEDAEEEGGFSSPPPLDFIGSPPAAARSLPGSPCGPGLGPGPGSGNNKVPGSVKKQGLEERSATLPEGDINMRPGRSREKKNRDLYKNRPKNEEKNRTSQGHRDKRLDSSGDRHQDHHHHHQLTFAGFFHKLRKTNSDGGGKRGGIMGQQPSWVVVEFPSSCLEGNDHPAGPSRESPPVSRRRCLQGDFDEDEGMETEVAVSEERIVLRKKPLAKAKSAEVSQVTTTTAIVERTSDSVFVSEEEGEGESEEEEEEVPPPPPPHRTTWTSADLRRDLVPVKASSVDSAANVETSKKAPVRSDRKRRTLTRSHAINVHPFGDQQEGRVRLTPPEGCRQQQQRVTRVKSADGQPSLSSSSLSSPPVRFLREDEKREEEEESPPPVPPHQNQSTQLATRQPDRRREKQQQQQQQGTPTGPSTFRRKLPSEEGDFEEFTAMKLDPADRSQSAGGLLSKQRPVSLILSKKSVSSSQYSTNGQQYDAHRREQSTHLTTTTTATIVKVTSQDSIGNCSLNVHAAAGETGDGGQNTRDNLMTASASTRDLKSVSMEPDIANSSSSSSSRRQQWPAGMMSGAHVIAPGSGPHQSGSIRRRIGSIEILDNRPPVGTQQFDSHPGLKPSYVHLACAVSGYSDINRYNSKLRDGFRSRDSSPVKIAWLRNSPMTSPKSTSTGSGTSTFIPGDENGQHAPLQRLKSPTLVVVSGGNDSPLSPRTPSGLRSPLKVLEIQQQQEKLLRGGYGATTFGSGRSVSVDRARFFDSPSVMTKVSPGFYTESLSSNRKSGSWARTENEYLDTEKERQSRSSRRAMNGSGPTTPSRAAGVGNGDAGRQVGQEDKEYAEAISSGKSFIQQRIERLYGQQRRKSDAEDDVDAAVLANVKKREEKREEEEKEKEKEEEKKKNKTKMLLGAAPAPGTVPAVAKAVEKHGGPPEAPGTPPVFRHLRQEFREQLPLAKKLGGKKKLQQQQHQPSRAVSSVSLTLARPDLETKGARAEANAGAAKSAAEEDEASVSLSTASSSSNNNKNNNNNSSSTTAGGSVSVHLSTDHEKEAEAAGAIASTPALSSPTAADDAVEEGRKGVEPVSTRSPSPTTDAVVSEIDNDDDVSSATDSYSYPIVKDGNYYVKVMDDERERLTGFIVPAEDEVALGKLPEEASGILRATTGKARLLLDQKFAQFKSLCDKNLIPGGEGETKVTNEDLAGFWDMVSIQVEQINEMFKDIEDLRKNGWTVVEKPNIVAKSAKRPSNSKKRSGPSPTPSKTPSPANAPPSAATRRADERRKQLLEAKRRMKREFEGKQQQQEQEQQGHDNDDGEGNGRTSPNSEL